MVMPKNTMFGIIILGISFSFLLLFQITQIIDAIKRQNLIKKKWLIFNSIPILGILFSIYYYSKILPNLKTSSKVKVKKVKQTPPAPIKKQGGGLISKPVSKADIKRKPVVKPEQPKPKEGKKVLPEKRSEITPSILIPEKKEPRLFKVEDKQTALVGYGEQRKLDKIEEHASLPPVRGRKRIHEVDKVEHGDTGLLITYGLHRFEIAWDDIYLIVGGQAPVDSNDSMMIDMFSLKNYAPYRIFDQKIMYQHFVPTVEYNIDKNFRGFLRFLIQKISNLPMDPDTRDFISLDNKFYANTYKNFHAFNQYVWKVRSQVIEDYNIRLDVPGAKDEFLSEQSNKITIEIPREKDEVHIKKFALILRGYEDTNKDDLVILISKLLKWPTDKAEKILDKTPTVIAKNVPEDVSLKLSRKFFDLNAQIQGIPMDEYEKMKRKK